MTRAELWLSGRAEGVPPTLLENMVSALPDLEEEVPTALATGAISLYAAVARGDGGRADALPLLAADALFTHAFEAQAEVDPDGLEGLVLRCEARLGEIVP